MADSKELLVISTYPPKGTIYGSALSAVASYTKNTLQAIKYHIPEISLTVLADITGSTESYNESGIAVIRCWKRNSFALYINLLSTIVRNFHIRAILFEFEWGMFGNNKWLIGLLPLFLVTLRLLGKKIYIVAHGVLLDADDIAQQLGFEKKSVRSQVYSFGLIYLYWFIIFLSKRVIVFEEELREKLLRITNQPTKIITIPHGVENPKRIVTKESARRQLGIKDADFIVMVFGFLIWYKGSDWVVSTLGDYFSKTKETSIKLWMVGGESSIHKHDPIYQSFLSNIFHTTDQHKEHITITGFIKEKLIPVYFSAADMVVLPYKAFLSSSGPLSFAFSYEKPMLISSSLGNYSKTKDFVRALTESGLKESDIVFDLDEKDLINKLEKCIQDKKFIGTLTQFSKRMKEKRAWRKIGKQYADLLAEVIS